MRKKFLKIVSAATAMALSLTIGVSSAIAAEDDTKVSASSTVDLTGEKAKLIITNNNYAEKYDQLFEEALKKEVAEIDNNFEKYEPIIKAGNDPYAAARKRAEKAAQDECEKLGLYSTIELTPMPNVPYKGWTGTFEVADIATTTLSFDNPTRFTCTAGGGMASISGKIGYYNMYKRASVTVTFSNGTTSSDIKSGTGRTVSAAALSKTGVITKGSYSLYMYDGTDSSSGLYEVAYITLTKK